jgi:hypothetical protein
MFRDTLGQVVADINALATYDSQLKEKVELLYSK